MISKKTALFGIVLMIVGSIVLSGVQQAPVDPVNWRELTPFLVDFNGWDADSTIMADIEPDSVYTVDVVFDSGSVKYQEFKFVRWDAAVADWVLVSNRVFIIDDSGPTQV